MRIIGIDPGLRITGFGVVDFAHQRLSYIASGTIETSSAKHSTPERLLLELKGKFGTILTAIPGVTVKQEVSTEILQALLALGYSDKEAVLAIKQIPTDVSVSDGIRAALKTLSKA